MKISYNNTLLIANEIRNKRKEIALNLKKIIKHVDVYIEVSEKIRMTQNEL